MISRYTRPEAAEIWSAQSRFRIMFEIEAHAADAMAELGVIPKAAAAAIWERGRDAVFDTDRIDAIERETRHDVIAFLTHVTEIVGPEARFLHQGMTSSDVNDTALAVQLARATDLLLDDVGDVLTALERRAFEFRHTPCVGRSHGVHAEPTTFGLKLAGHYAEFVRARERLITARSEIATCAISGPVGTFASVDPRVEAHVAKKLGLRAEPISTQVIPRDRHAAFFAALGVVASSVERLAVEIRHLQRTEVLEVEEPFDAGQKGSSAMPHKRNPILSENLTGLARLVRSAVIPALEDVALWHERDISHSSVERGIAPDTTVHLDFALRRLAGLVERLVVYPGDDGQKPRSGPQAAFVHSQNVLLALTQKGMTREAAYAAVQRNAMKAWRGEGAFRLLLAADPEVGGVLSEADFAAAFDPASHLFATSTRYSPGFSARPRRKPTGRNRPPSSASTWPACTWPRAMARNSSIFARTTPSRTVTPEPARSWVTLRRTSSSPGCSETDPTHGAGVVVHVLQAHEARRPLAEQPVAACGRPELLLLVVGELLLEAFFPVVESGHARIPGEPLFGKVQISPPRGPGQSLEAGPERRGCSRRGRRRRQVRRFGVRQRID